MLSVGLLGVVVVLHGVMMGALLHSLLNQYLLLVLLDTGTCCHRQFVNNSNVRLGTIELTCSLSDHKCILWRNSYVLF